MAKNELTEGMKIVDGYLVVVKEVEVEPRLSASGKSWIKASTNGRETFVHDGEEIHVNLNAYTMK